MGFQCGAVNEDVVEEDRYEFPEVRLKDVVHECLKAGALVRRNGITLNL